MSAIITKKFRFEAAHHLPQFPEGHKCRRLHGHSFRVEIKVKGQINPDTGIIIDFGDIKKVTKPYIEMLDHYCLNEVGEEKGIDLLKLPSSENICKWLFHELEPKLEGLHSVVVHETCTCSCEYFGDA